MSIFSLNGQWNAFIPNKTEVTVPGCFDSYMEQKDYAKPVRLEKTFKIEKDNEYSYNLCCRAVSYYCEIKLNGIEIGSHEGMWDSFGFDITDALKNGENTLEITATKPGYYSTDAYPLREVLSGFIPDVLCTFGGIWDDIFIEKSKSVFFDCHYAKGDESGGFEIVLGVERAVATGAQAEVSVTVKGPNATEVYKAAAKVNLSNKDIVLNGQIDKPSLWQPQTPNLYTYTAVITCGGESITLSKSFGFRTVRAEGTKMTVNGVPVYLRGALHWGYYDKEFIPRPSKEIVEKEISDMKAYGFNAVKHCLYIPRETYLTAGDENGIMQWVELPLWLPEPTEHLSARIRREYPRIIRQISGHPSVVLTSLGCELDDKVDSCDLKEMYELIKQQTDTLVKDNSGSGECYGGLKVEYADYFDYHFYADLQNFENLLENFTPTWRNNKPWFFGEFCDSDVMRNLYEIREKYGVDRLMWETGDKHKNPICVLKPDFFAHHHDERIKESGILERFEEIHKLSLQHSLTHRKLTLELTRAEPVIGGYNITSLRDVPLCANGMFDDMGNPRFDAKLFNKSNSDDVLCPAWDLGRIWLSADRVQPHERFNYKSGSLYGLHVLLSHYSLNNIKKPKISYTLTENDKVLEKGELTSAESFSVGDVKELCYISFKLPETASPRSLMLNVCVKAEATIIENSWPVFLYPVSDSSKVKLSVYDSSDILRGIDKLYEVNWLSDGEEISADTKTVVTTRLTSEIRKFAQNGGKVVLVQRGTGSLPVRHCSFWREGMLRREESGFLSKLAHLYPFDDLRFYEVGCETAFTPKAVEKEGFTNYKPILRRYDCREWLAHDYIASMSLGKGSIIATTLRLEGTMGKQPIGFENNCFAQWILGEMIK